MPKLTQKIANIAFGDIVGRGLGFITTVYLARVLGAESYGIIVIALSYLGYATWLADLGLTHIGGREVAKEPEKRVFRAREIFYLKIILNLIALGLVQLIVRNLNLPEDHKEVILAFSYALIPYIFILEWYYNGRQRFGVVASSKILNSSIYLFLVAILVHAESELPKIPLYFIAGSTGSGLLFLLFSIKEKPFQLPYRGFGVLKDLFLSAITIGSGTFFTQMIQHLPPIVIGFFLSTQDAGVYGAAIKVIFIAMLVDRVFVNLLLPNLSAQWTINKSTAKEHLKIVSRIMISLAGLLSLFVAISSPFTIEILFGAEYREGGKILSILSILLFFTFLNSLFSFGLIAIGKDEQFFNSTLIGGMVGLVLILASALTGNLVNLTFAISLSEAIFTFSAFYWFNKHTQLEILSPVCISILILGLLYYVSTIIHFHVLIEAIIASVLFIPLILITGVLKLDHLHWLKQKMIS